MSDTARPKLHYHDGAGVAITSRSALAKAYAARDAHAQALPPHYQQHYVQQQHRGDAAVPSAHAGGDCARGDDYYDEFGFARASSTAAAAPAVQPQQQQHTGGMFIAADMSRGGYAEAVASARAGRVGEERATQQQHQREGGAPSRKVHTDKIKNDRDILQNILDPSQLTSLISEHGVRVVALIDAVARGTPVDTAFHQLLSNDARWAGMYPQDIRGEVEGVLDQRAGVIRRLVENARLISEAQSLSERTQAQDAVTQATHELDETATTLAAAHAQNEVWRAHRGDIDFKLKHYNTALLKLPGLAFARARTDLSAKEFKRAELAYKTKEKVFERAVSDLARTITLAPASAGKRVTDAAGSWWKTLTGGEHAEAILHASRRQQEGGAPSVPFMVRSVAHRIENALDPFDSDDDTLVRESETHVHPDGSATVYQTSYLDSDSDGDEPGDLRAVIAARQKRLTRLRPCY